MRCHNIFLIPLLFFYALSCDNSAEINQEKIRTAKKTVSLLQFPHKKIVQKKIRLLKKSKFCFPKNQGS